VTLHTDRLLVPPSPCTRTLAARLRAPHASQRQPRPALDVALVLDRSGSMAGFKLALARSAAERALQLLRPDDRFALVVYDDRADVLVEMTPATREAISRAATCLREVEARGSTDLGAGWQHGCAQVLEQLTAERLGRCLLLTDGLANTGLVEHGPLVELATSWQARGVVTSTFGVGADFDEDLLQKIAHTAHGHFYFIESARHIGDVLASELGESLDTVARDVRLAVRLPRGCCVDVLSDHQAGVGADGTFRIVVGDLTSGETVDVALVVSLPGTDTGEHRTAESWIEDRDGTMPGGIARTTWTGADAQDVESQGRNADVDHLRARMEAARARRAAVVLNKAGDCFGAGALLRDVAATIRRYADADLGVLQIADDLGDQAAALSMPLHSMQRKRIHFAASSALKSRDSRGRARRA
jgi:Ca-activated chloride channel family protein